MRKKDDLLPMRHRMQRKGQTGVYYVLKSMEKGPSFRIVKPKFSRHEREGIDLRCYYYLSQVEYAQSIVFKRNHPIHSIFERSCDLGLARITPQRMAHIFGWRITKRTV